MPTVGGLYLKWRELREIPFCGFTEVFCKKKTEGNVVADILVVLTLQLLTTVKLPLLQKTHILQLHIMEIYSLLLVTCSKSTIETLAKV